MLDQELGALNKLKVESNRGAGCGSNTVAVHSPVLAASAQVVRAISALQGERVGVGAVDLDAARCTLEANKAVLAAENKAGAVNEGKCEQRGGVRAVAVGNQATVGAHGDVLAVVGNKLDAVAQPLKTKSDAG